MKNMQKVMYMASGFLICMSIVVTAPAIAANVTKSLQATYRDIKLVVDGKAVTSENEPFVVEGKTYLPVSDVAKALGKEVSWDGNTSTVYIGAKPGVVAEKAKLSDFEPLSKSGTVNWTANDTDNFGNKYTHGIKFYSSNANSNVHREIVLNGKYKKLTATVTPAFLDDINTALYFYSLSDTDTVKLYQTKTVSKLTQPFQIEVDLTGVNALRIDWDGVDGNGSSSIGLVNAFLE